MLQTQKLPRAIDALDALFAFLETQFVEHSVDENTAYWVKLASEEIFTNMVRHNVSQAATIALGIEISPDQVHLQLIDSSVAPFDLSAIPPVDIRQPMTERRPGGLGIHLVRAIVDRFTCEYENGEMRVSITKQRRS